MNHETDHIPSFEAPAQEREWLAQESAMRRERLHLDLAGDDARSQQYRLLARTLRVAPTDGLPADFAQRVSAKIGQALPALVLERTLAIALASVMLLAAAVVTVAFGAAWWPSFKELMLPAATAQWWLALSGCVALTWMLGACTSLEKSSR